MSNSELVPPPLWLLERRRQMMGKHKKYVDVFAHIFPSNGTVNGTYAFYLYTTEKMPIGTSVHIALKFTAMDESATTLEFRQSAYQTRATVPMPSISVDVEFVLTQATGTFWCYFDKTVANVQIDVTSIKLEKII